MLYSRNTQYALRALAFMAQHESGTVLSTREIARAERIPAPSLAKVMKRLARARMVRPGRGRKGGYALVADPRRLSLWRVTVQFDDPAQFSRCIIGLRHCSDARPCSLHPYWRESREAIERFLKRVHISDVAVAASRARRQRSRTT